MRKTLTYIFLLLMVFGLHAQTPSQVMQQFMDKLSAQTLSADYTLSVGEGLTPMTGHIDMRGECFLLRMLDTEAAYDGKTLMVFSTESNELTLTIPEQQELLSSNPVLYAKALLPMCDLRFSPKANQQNVYVIDLLPREQSAGISAFTIRLAKSTLLPQSITIQEEAQKTTLKLINAKYTATTPTFVLTKPKAYVNDLR